MVDLVSILMTSEEKEKAEVGRFDSIESSV